MFFTVADYRPAVIFAFFDVIELITDFGTMFDRPKPSLIVKRR